MQLVSEMAVIPSRISMDPQHGSNPRYPHTAWIRRLSGAEKMPRSNPKATCVLSVNPPPRWWVFQNGLQVPDSQSKAEETFPDYWPN
jgi:hypothetical protein